MIIYLAGNPKVERSERLMELIKHRLISYHYYKCPPFKKYEKFIEKKNSKLKRRTK